LAAWRPNVTSFPHHIKGSTNKSRAKASVLNLVFAILKCLTYIEYTNVSVSNTTIYFTYIKQYIDGATCFDLHWVILGPSKKTDPRLHICFTETYCGIPNAHRMLQGYSINCRIHVFINIGATTATLN
jgi:hypothetical protein